MDTNPDPVLFARHDRTYPRARVVTHHPRNLQSLRIDAMRRELRAQILDARFGKTISISEMTFVRRAERKRDAFCAMNESIQHVQWIKPRGAWQLDHARVRRIFHPTRARQFHRRETTPLASKDE